MKTIFKTMIVMASFAITITSCSQPSHILDKFLGKWKNAGKTGDTTCTIKIENKAIIAIWGVDTCAGVYDEQQDVLKFYVWGNAGIVKYNTKTNHLLLNNGQDGEYEKIN